MQLVSEPTGGPEAREIREALRERLPPYMIPSAGVVFLDELPLGPAGKVDRRRLPVQLPVPATAPVPRNGARAQHRAHLGRRPRFRPIGPDDDFFTLGGDSLASAEIVARLEGETGVSLSMSLVAGAPTVRALAAELRKVPAVLDSTLVVLRTGEPEAALVLLHGNRGHALHYAGLVRVAGADAPIWALEHPRLRGKIDRRHGIG